ncbi:MAG TPA: hypothetical protein VGS11_00660 [Candidatus Bathyarchaeia archaeon]|nr:hypothetical protein [Candidatus Bathyarchaeia archaeon]
MTSINPQVNFILKISESFWTRLGCIIRGHNYQRKYLGRRPLPNGYVIGHATYICIRCGKFRDWPTTFKEWLRHPFELRTPD